MGLFRRLLGRDDRDRSRQQPPAGVAVGQDPTSATFLPDWSEYWIATTREQAAGSVHPYPPVDPAQLADSAELTDDSEPTAQDSTDAAGAGLLNGYLTVDLTPPGLNTSAPVDASTANLAAVNITAVDDLQLQPSPPAAEDLAPLDAAAVGDVSTEPGFHDRAAVPVADLGFEGQAWLPADVLESWGTEGSVLDELVAATPPASGSGALQSLPPPAADAVVLDVPPPLVADPIAGPQLPDRAYPSAAAQEYRSDYQVTDYQRPEPEVSAAMPALAPEPAAAQAIFAGLDDVVLDVRDPSGRSGNGVEPGSHVVLGFGDGTEQQLAGDDPDIGTFHALAAALTWAPRHRA